MILGKTHRSDGSSGRDALLSNIYRTARPCEKKIPNLNFKS
jgi:hypothetical protein